VELGRAEVSTGMMRWMHGTSLK